MIGPLSIRVYMTCIMIFVLLFDNLKKTINCNYIKIDSSFIKFYVAFLIVMGLSQLFNGDFIEYEYVKKLLAYHLVSIVLFLAIQRYINTYRDLQNIILLVSTILLINNMIIILQFLGYSFGWAFGAMFGDIQSSIDYAETHDTLLGFSNTPGIFGNVVRSAFFIAVTSPLVLCLIRKDSSKIIKILVFFVGITSCIASFMTQQRTAFALVLLSVFIYILVIFKKNPLLIFILSLFCFPIVISNIEFSQVDIGRLADNSDEIRSNLYKMAFEFISDYPLFGGPMKFQNSAGLSTHNILLDSWIFAGFFGFVIMILLLFKTIINSFNILVKGFKLTNPDTFMIFSAIATINAMAYGFLHNTSYLTGDVIIFLVLSLMLKSFELRRYNIL